MTVFMFAPRSVKWDELRTLKQVVDLDQLQKENSRQVLSLWTALTVRGRMMRMINRLIYLCSMTSALTIHLRGPSATLKQYSADALDGFLPLIQACR